MKTQELLELIEKEFGVGCRNTCEERKEQIEKHGYDITNDQFYKENELIKGTLFAINSKQFACPYNWTSTHRLKIINKPEGIERLKVASALIAAEMDRIDFINNINNNKQ